jgi:4-hydroxy-3-polyprenylbenzoate decarboxylase
MSGPHILLAITGASGVVYGVALARELLRSGARLTLLISRPGFAVLREECSLDWEGEAARVSRTLTDYFGGPVTYYADDDLLAPVASGSSAPDAMVVCPCTMGTVGRIAAGLSGTLIERAADVMLKERRPLLLVPRETPLSEIHLENLLKLARSGVRIVPAMPAFYHHPSSLDDQVNFMVGKVLDQLGLAHTLFPRWGTDGETGEQGRE